MKKLIVLLLILSIVPSVYAQQGHMNLLAVSETEQGQVGGIADLFLEINPGSGRVFLETFPLTRIDTQVSTRFAKQVACDFAKVDCEGLDFFYTITSNSPIIAGPSAGSAIAVLTFSLITGEKIDKDTAITGTINSGGLIGPVGGIKAKIEAASKIGIRKILIPSGEIMTSNFNLEKNESINSTLDIKNLSKELNVKILEVPTLDDALFEFTGKRFRQQRENLTISESYKDTMKLLAIELCSRSTRLKEETSDSTNNNFTRDLRNNAVNLSDKGKLSFKENKFYSAASYCFGSNVEFNYLSLLNENISKKDIVENVEELRTDIGKFESNIENKKVKTITQLESYMVVKERLLEAENFLELTLESIGDSNVSLRNLAYSQERLNSAKSWAKFMENSGKEFDLNKNVIRNACQTKISEVEERLQYVELTLPQNLESTRKELSYAYNDLANEKYELCLFKASKAKANVDSILSVFGVRIENVGAVVEQRLNVAERTLVEETEKGIFPVLGYSYFEYANSLKDDDPFSALLYSGYALELSNLDIYFRDISKSMQKKENILNKIDKNAVFILIIGILIGIVITKSYYSKRVKK
ncbi:hypothetical protein ISS07_01285 [Candidatus Woesearchaeota archaeon]|nr:hypothetical protein [Candidatus Woesearchaeota archaeon]